jgi:hypothetical protein
MKSDLISVDFEKAYDLVNRDVFWKMMDAMGYPAMFIHWLQTMHNNVNPQRIRDGWFDK